MRHKSKRSRVVQDYSTPPTLYQEFIVELRSILSSDLSFKAQYLGSVVESKLLDETVTPALERRERAIEKWLATEVRNAETNRRLLIVDETDILFTTVSDERHFPISAVDVLSKARQFISQTIGESPDLDKLGGSFSGGASTSIKRGVGSIPRKYLYGKDITETAIELFLALSKDIAGMPRDFRVVPGNVLFTVPKTSTIDRCAAKEPDLNMYCQKAVGDYLRLCLRREGINLNDQTINQRLAHEGATCGELATLDLSSASDSVTKQLVLQLMPVDWSMLLFDLRSPFTKVDDVLHENEMISSMGNAFTFELESLIFWALARATAFLTATRGKISVYGDDLIVPCGMVGAFTEVLDFMGFKLNPEKSFSDGPFRESCGKHWHSKTDVTPFYIRKVPVDITDWILILNSLRKWSEIGGGICDPQYFDLWSKYSEVVPKPLHGGKDLARRDCLVVPYVKSLSRLVRKQTHDRVSEIALQDGLYMRWCDTTKDRDSESNYMPYSFENEGVLVLRRAPTPDQLGCPVFPQEIRD
jgi:hypothetical protein